MGLSVVWIAVGIAVWIAPGGHAAPGPARGGTDRAIRIGTEKLMVIGSTVTFAQGGCAGTSVAIRKEVAEGMKDIFKLVSLQALVVCFIASFTAHASHL